MRNDFRRSSFVNLREILSPFDWLHVHKCENRNGHDLCNSYWCHDCTKLSESLKMYHILDRSEKLTENQNAKSDSSIVCASPIYAFLGLRHLNQGSWLAKSLKGHKNSQTDNFWMARVQQSITKINKWNSWLPI